MRTSTHIQHPQYRYLTNEHVVTDVVQVTSVLEPGSCHTDVVCCALALGLDQNSSILDVVTIPRRERL